MKFTEEQIREAATRIVSRTGSHSYTANDLLDELTRPQQEFRDGEIVYSRTGVPGGIHYFPWTRNFRPAPNLDMRPLTLSEMPQVVEDLREAVLMKIASGPHADLESALAAFDERVGK